MSLFKNANTSAEESRRATRAATTALVVAVVAIVNVILALLGQTFDWYLYRARYTEDFSISGKTDELFGAAIDGDTHVTVTFCMTENDLKNHAMGAFVLDTAKQFEQRYDFIDLRFVNLTTKLDDETGERVNLEEYLAEGEKLSRTSVIFSSPIGHRVLTSVYNNTGFVDFFTLNSTGEISAYNGETVIASMISWVLQSEHKTAYLTQNHGEIQDTTFVTVLASAGYYVKYINLQDGDVPEDCGLLVISGPKNDFERSKNPDVRTEMERLEAYLRRGGNIYISLDPYVSRLPNLEEFMKKHGIAYSETEVDGKLLRNIVKDPDNAVTTDGYTLIANYATDNSLASDIENRTKQYASGGIVIREASALNLSGNAKAILKSSKSSICEVGQSVTDRGGSYTVAASVSVTDELTGKVGNIFVVPSVFLTASDALISNRYSNRDFIYSLFEELYGSKNMPHGCNFVTYVSDDVQNLTMGAAKLYTALLLTIPCALAIVGAVVIIRRKNR